MALEIERKFRVTGDGWKSQISKSRRIRQAYLTKNGRISIRVRIWDDDSAALTIKTAEPGITRNEFEYEIPIGDAEELILRREGAVIAKVRHLVPAGNLVWEIDVFEGDNAGLVIAELELERQDQNFERPAWLGKEVTGERRFYNADLAKRPFSDW